MENINFTLKKLLTFYVCISLLLKNNSLNGFTSRLNTAEERNRELKDSSIETIQLKHMWEIVGQFNICVTRIPE